MTDRDDWLREKSLEREGFELRAPAVRLHGRRETPRHLCVKAVLALKLQRAGRRWDTEVNSAGGRVDVLDLGPPDGRAVVYEVETGATPEKRREKASQYAGGAVRDVITVDPAEAPGEPREILGWLDNFVIGQQQ